MVLRNLVLAWAGLAAPVAGFTQVVGAPPNGRLLASNCFQCHGTDGKAVSGFEKLAGMSASELRAELAEMKAEGEGGIMGAHALAYTDAQISAIAGYFATVGQKTTRVQNATTATAKQVSAVRPSSNNRKVD